MAAKAAALPAQHGRGSDDDEGLLPGGPHPGQPDPQEAVAPSKSQPLRRSLVDGQLLPQGEVLEGELAAAAVQEGRSRSAWSKRVIIGRDSLRIKAD